MQHSEALELLGPTPQKAGWNRTVFITIDNQIKELPKGVQWSVNVMQFLLAPQGGKWITEPTQGEPLPFSGNPLRYEAQNTTFPGSCQGWVQLLCQGNANARINFLNSAAGASADCNGHQSGYVGPLLFNVQTQVVNQNFNVNFSFIKYCQ